MSLCCYSSAVSVTLWDTNISFRIISVHLISREEDLDLLDDRRVFGSIAGGSHPLIHHDPSVAVDQEAQEEEDDGGDDHDAQRVELVVLRKAGTVEVEAGVQLDADQGQNDADPVGDGLRVGLEVLQDQLETLHDSNIP